MPAPERNLVGLSAGGLEDAPSSPGSRIASVGAAAASFVGLAPAGPLDRAVPCASYADFARAFTLPERPRAGPHLERGSLAHAVRGFFANGGQQCLVARAAGRPGAATTADHLAALALLLPLEGGTSLVAPDLHVLDEGPRELQRHLVEEAARTAGAMALLDPPSGLDPEGVVRWRRTELGDTAAAALFYPWVQVPDPATGGVVSAPPAGWAAGVWTRTDVRHGPDHAATGQAVLALEGLDAEVDAGTQRLLNRSGVNCLRAWPGPEPRLWGGRSLSTDAAFCHVHHRRLVAHIAVSVAAGTRWAVAQADDLAVQERVRTAILAFLGTWWRRGALQGATPGQAFSASLEGGPGGLVIELGLALRRPSDLHVVRISRAS